MSFLSDIEDFKEKVLQAASDNTNTVYSDLFNKEVELSPSSLMQPLRAPYSNDLMKNQWYATSGNSYSRQVGSVASSSGSDSLSRISSLVDEHLFYGRDNAVSLSNSTEEAYYADKLGWAKGFDARSGWTWKGAAPYNITQGAIAFILNKYPQ